MSGNGKSKFLKVFGIAGGILFFVSFIPWLLISIPAFTGITEDIFGSENIYGFAAERNLIYWFSILPVFPICILIESLYAIFYIRKAEKSLKVAAISITAVTIVLLLTPGIIWWIKDQSRCREYEPGIREYLKEEFGETMSREADISLKYYDTPTFTITSPVLPKGEEVEIQCYEDRYMEFFMNSYRHGDADFAEDLNNYLDDEFGLPENMHLEVRADKIDFGDYHYGDDHSVLYTKTEYDVCKIYVELETVNYDELMNIPVTVYNDYVPLFEDSVRDYFMIEVTDRGTKVCDIQIDMPFEGNHNRAVAVYTFTPDYKQFNYMEAWYFIDEIGKEVVHMA